MSSSLESVRSAVTNNDVSRETALFRQLVWTSLFDAVIEADAMGRLVSVRLHATDQGPKLPSWPNSTTEKVAAWLQRYAMTPISPPSVPLAFDGASEFRRSVWSRLLDIRIGETLHYGDIAKTLGDARKARAVGGAVGANPFAILVPCHRVLPSSGGLGNYSSAAGVPMKKALLIHEGALMV